MTYFTRQDAERLVERLRTEHGRAISAHADYIVAAAMSDEVNSCETFEKARAVLAVKIADRVMLPKRLIGRD